MTKHDMGQFPLSPARRDDLHDSITLALDAIRHNPDARNLAEARAYLRSALRLIGGCEMMMRSISVPGEIEGVRALFSAVILQAMADSAEIASKVGGVSPDHAIEGFRRWLHSSDGRACCELAGLALSQRTDEAMVDRIRTMIRGRTAISLSRVPADDPRRHQVAKVRLPEKAMAAPKVKREPKVKPPPYSKKGKKVLAREARMGQLIEALQNGPMKGNELRRAFGVSRSCFSEYTTELCTEGRIVNLGVSGEAGGVIIWGLQGQTSDIARTVRTAEERIEDRRAYLKEYLARYRPLKKAERHPAF